MDFSEACSLIRVEYPDYQLDKNGELYRDMYIVWSHAKKTIIGLKLPTTTSFGVDVESGTVTKCPRFESVRHSKWCVDLDENDVLQIENEVIATCLCRRDEHGRVVTNSGDCYLTLVNGNSVWVPLAPCEDYDDPDPKKRAIRPYVDAHPYGVYQPDGSLKHYYWSVHCFHNSEENLRRHDPKRIRADRNLPTDDQLPDWAYCWVSNVVDERLYGRDKVVREGTQHFRPGAKLYCLPSSWGDAYESLCVLGQPRKSRHFIKLIFRRREMTNFRIEKVRDKRVIRELYEPFGRRDLQSDELHHELNELLPWFNSDAQEIECQLNDYLRESALKLAIAVHEGQVDKGGRPYIEHPLAVEGLVSTPKQRVVALLHDVVEDTGVTLDDLKCFGQQVVKAVDAITKRPGEPLNDYLIRVEANPLARAVKIADLTHNSDLSRIPNPTQKDYERVEQYQEKIAILSKRKD
jgi:hypothetical protein